MLLVRPLRRAQLVLTGEDRVRFLHGMVTNDVAKLATGRGCHAAMLTTKGKMLADLVILAEPESLRLILDAELGDKIRTVLDKHIVMDDVELTDASAEPVCGVYGDEAAAAVAARLSLDAAALDALPHYAFVQAGAIRVVRTPELGLPGFQLLGDDGASFSGATELSADEHEALRVEAGTPRYGVDMGEDRLPIEAGIQDAVSFDKGCYLGQEVIARATNLGHINRKLVGLKLDGDGPAASGTKLTSASRPEAGFITSSVQSPRFGSIALGYVHRTLWEPGVELTLADGRRAVVTALPFRQS